jgi:amidohydrolase
MGLSGEASALQDKLVRLRRELHRQPELGLDLPRTQQRVLAWLRGLPLEISTGRSLSSVTAALRGSAANGGAVLLRADMDALPGAEQTGLDFAAPAGAMHACGHDLHTAMLAGAARLLTAHRDGLAGTVVFMFQPGEEGHDGARRMLEEGVLEAAGQPLTAAYAVHVAAGQQRGVFMTRPGPIMAALDVLTVTVRGRGGHASVPHRARDPVPAACEMVTALQTLVTRRFDAFDPVVLTVGCLQAGTSPYAVPDSARFEASVRSFSPQSRARVREESVRVCKGIAAAHGLDAEAETREMYPVTVNDDAEAAFSAAVVQQTFGQQRHHLLAHPLTPSEDFSRVLQAVPGALVVLGACPPHINPDTAATNHSSTAVFDDSVLADGAQFYAELALRRLTRKTGTDRATGR